MNSRFGNIDDSAAYIDQISKRKIIDFNINRHGEVFLDFLLESKMCVIKGRVCPENDNFTHVHTTGSSVVDCICTFYDNVEHCKYFKVHLTRNLLDKIGVYTDKIPDHSVPLLNILSLFIKKQLELLM